MSGGSDHRYEHGSNAAELFFRLGRRLAAAALLGFGLLAMAAEPEWPVIAMPKEVDSFAASGSGALSMNGVPMRVQGFVSGATPDRLAARFRQSLGQPLVENVREGKLILGRMQGEFYLTVQIEPAGKGSRGVAAVSHLKAAYAEREESKASTEHLLARLPSGSAVISRMESVDRDTSSRQLVILNSLTEDLNRDRVKDWMRDEGMTLEREIDVDRESDPKLAAPITGGKSLYFKGPEKEAMAIICRDASGRTTIVLNTITRIRRFK